MHLKVVTVRYTCSILITTWHVLEHMYSKNRNGRCAVRKGHLPFSVVTVIISKKRFFYILCFYYITDGCILYVQKTNTDNVIYRFIETKKINILNRKASYICEYDILRKGSKDASLELAIFTAIRALLM